MAKTLRVGMIGYNFMGKAHSNAWRQVNRFFELPAQVELNNICGRNSKAVEKAAHTFGWARSATDWRAVVEDPNLDIIDITTPNDTHAQIAIAAAEAGKAVLCEKPLGMDVPECEKMVAAVKQHKVVNMVCHNYRRIPAIAHARKLIAEGALGDRLYHYRARYAQDWIADPNFPLVWRLKKEIAGSGAHGDTGGHIIDYEHTFVNTFADFVTAVVNGKSVQPTFEDGLQNEKVLAAIEASARKRERVKV